MKLCAAQIKPVTGSIEKNIDLHKKWIEKAISESADLIIFPELSLTGYEPQLADKLAVDSGDSRLDEFQVVSNAHDIIIGVGIPTRDAIGNHISMIFFQPQRPWAIYSKQILHADEQPYFKEGNEQLILEVKNKKPAPAICYESLQIDHIEKAKKLGADIYLASVAKSLVGIEKAYKHYPGVAHKFSMPVLLSNSIGFCDNFVSAGQSAIWNEKGELVSKLERDNEGLLLYDTESKRSLTLS